MTVTAHFDTVTTSFGGDYQYYRETHLASVSSSYTTFPQKLETRSVSIVSPSLTQLIQISTSNPDPILSYLKANR